MWNIFTQDIDHIMKAKNINQESDVSLKYTKEWKTRLKARHIWTIFTGALKVFL